MDVTEALRHHFDRRVVIVIHRVDSFFKAINGHRNTIDIFWGIDAKKCKPPPWWTELAALWGCNESHKAVIARALSDGLKTLLVMEDDCRFAPGAAEVIDETMREIPPDWDGVMFGGQVNAIDSRTEPVSARISKCFQVERLHCYGMTRRGMEIFYHALCEPGNSLANDYRWGDLQEQGKLICYRSEPFVAIQCEGMSSISARVEPERIWDDRINVRLRAPADVPVVSLICPFPAMDRMRREGIVCNCGESPPDEAKIDAGRVERGEIQIADVALLMASERPESFKSVVWKMRCDAAFHRDAILALWHPSKPIPFDGAPVIMALDYDDAVRQLSGVTQLCSIE